MLKQTNFSFQLVSDKVRYVVGTFNLSLNSSGANDEDTTACDIDEKDDCDLGSIGFTLDHKNRVDLKEKAGTAVEMLRPVIPVSSVTENFYLVSLLKLTITALASHAFSAEHS